MGKKCAEREKSVYQCFFRAGEVLLDNERLDCVRLYMDEHVWRACMVYAWYYVWCVCAEGMCTA